MRAWGAGRVTWRWPGGPDDWRGLVRAAAMTPDPFSDPIPFPTSDVSVADAIGVSYSVSNTPATPLPHKGDAHFGQVFFSPISAGRAGVM